jgi:DNA-binding YbaB/EbfC family protein
MLDDLMGKLNQAQNKMEEIKKSMDNKFIEAEAGGGAVKVSMSWSRKVKSVTIDKSKIGEDVEELEDLITVAVNRALEKAESLSEEEMKNATTGMFPGFPGDF